MRTAYPIIIALFCVLTSCRPGNEEDDFVTSNKLRITSGFNGKSDTIVVKSSAPWVAQCDADWVQLSVVSADSLVVTIGANITLTSRSAAIDFICGDATYVIGVEQTAVPNGKLEQTLDSLALIAIYNNCGGQNWYYMPTKDTRPWHLEKPFSQWFGVQTTSIGGQTRVYSLDLSALGLTGALPGEILNLTELTAIAISGNSIETNPLPLIAKLPNIVQVDVGFNWFEGDGGLTDAGYLKNLLAFNISGINLNGNYPSYLGSMPNLRLLHMAGCNIQGKGVSGDLQKMTHLVELNLSDNPLSGAIPSWISSLKELEFLDLSTCALTGTIADGIGELSELETLKLGSNSLTGAVPISFENLKKLKTLNLSDNKFTSLPSGIGIDGLQEFDASYNSISGVIPVSLAENRTLKTINLANNKISGELSPLFGGNQLLETLIVNDNNITGNIDGRIASAKNLSMFCVFGNRMSGKLPSAITGDDRYVGYDETYPADEFNDELIVHISVWRPEEMILPQQQGYGFTQ